MTTNKNEKLNNHQLKIILLLTAILILAALLRFYHLGSRPLYWDEPQHTVGVASQSLSFIVSTNYGSNLYPLLLHFILPLGNTEFMARLPAALFGLLSVLGIFLVGKLLFGKKEGIIAALFLAVSTHSIYFSQQARGYSGLMLFSLFSLYFLLNALKENKMFFWVLYVLFSILNIYTIFLALIIIPVHIFFVAILVFDKWIQKKEIKKVIIHNKKLANFALCILLILIITFFLYLPGKNHTSGQLFSQSVKNVFKGEATLSLFPLIRDILKRQLEYYVCSPLFFLKLFLFFLGIIGCLKNQRRELILLLAYIIIPFSLFVLVKPVRAHLPADNKFIFIVPILLLLVAKGLAIIYSIFIKAASRLTKIKKISILRNISFVFLIVIILLSESVLLKDYYLQFWRIRSLDRSREVNTYLKKYVQSQKMIFFNNFLNKNKLLLISPLYYPDNKKKGVMIQESNGLWAENHLFQRIGLLVVFERLILTDKDISNLKNLSNDIKITVLSRSLIVHFQNEDQTLIEKLIKTLNFFNHLPIKKEEKIENHLILAKLYLVARRNKEALREFENIDKIKKKFYPLKQEKKQISFVYKIADRLFGLKKRDYHHIVQNILHHEISKFLIMNGNQLFLDGKYDDAIPLQKKAVEFNPQDGELRLFLADSYKQEGMEEEASNEYKEALKLNIKPKYEASIIDKIRELHSLSAGYIIWRQENIWHVRWWSIQKRVFSGSINVSLPIKQVKEYKLSKNDYYKVQGNLLFFKGIVKKGKIEGFDIIARANSKLAFDLKIDDQEDITDKIILMAEEKHPKQMPFLWK